MCLGGGGSIADPRYALSNGQNGRIRQFLSGGSVPANRVRFLFNGNRAADLFPARIVATRGTNIIELDAPDPRATQSFGQGTAMDYILSSGTITDVFVNGETVSVDLYD